MNPALLPSTRVIIVAVLVGGLAFAAAAQSSAQSAAPAASSAAPGGDAIQLDPFTVRSRPDEGYAAYNTVSGTGSSMPLQTLPLSINVITSEFLRDSLVGPTIEAWDYNTSITQFARTGVISKLANVTIRGFAARYILLDGVQAGNFINANLIDRIEVVKGPNTLYGQSDPGGVINVISKRPLAVNSFMVRGHAGNQGRSGGTLDASLRSPDKRVGLRFIYDQLETDGFRYVDGSRTDFGGIIGEYALPGNFTVDIYVTREKISSVPSERVAFPFQERPTDLNGDGVITSTIVGGVNETSAKYNNNFLPWEWTSQTTATHSDQKNNFGSVRLVKKITDKIDVQYRYGRTQGTFKLLSREYDTFNAAGVASFDIRAEDYKAIDKAHTVNASARFTLLGGDHNLLAGARWAEAESLRISRRFFLADGADAGQTRTPLQIITDIYRQKLANPSFNFRTQMTQAAALNEPIWLDPLPTFAETISFGKRFSSAGLAREEIKTFYLTDSVSYLQGRLHLLGGIRDVQIVSEGYDFLGKLVGSPNDQGHFGYQGGVSYSLAPRVTVYGSYTTAFIPNARNPDTNTYFAAGKSFAGELGLKVTDLWDGRITGSIAAFEIERTNVINQDFNPQTGFFVSELSDQRSRGIDLEVFFNTRTGWSAVAGYSYLDAKVVKSITASKGLRLEGAAPHRFSLWGSYTFPGALQGLRLGGGVIHVEGPVQQFGTSGNRYVAENGYTTVDLFARYTLKVTGRPLTLGVNIDNLNDEFYLRTRGTVSTPRQVLFSAEMTF